MINLDYIKNNIRNNKKIITICFLLIFIFFVIYIITSIINIYSDTSEEVVFLKNYKSNEYIPVKMTSDGIAVKYLNDFKNNMVSDVEEAYNSLNEEYRTKRFKDFDGFKKYVDDFMSLSFVSLELEKYSITNIGGNKIYNIYDGNGFQYIFKEISVMDYEVYLDEYTVEIK